MSPQAETDLGAIDCLDLDSVAAIIWMPNGRYLLQHREDRDDIEFPNRWGLFGGAREHGEDAETAVRREIKEELEFRIRDCSLFLGCAFNLWFERRRTRKIFFSIEMTEIEACNLALREGQAMAWLSFEEVMARANQVIPYDLGVIALHNKVRGV
jgi:8-oxo-dGTP diphosphatase